MYICTIGSGYVGLVSAACFAEMGNKVTCVDVNPEVIKKLNAGKVHIYEPGLEDLVLRNHQEGRLNFTTDLTEGMRDADFIFITVGTPSRDDGSCDLSYVEEVARDIGRNLQTPVIVVDKSTVPVGTADLVRGLIAEELKKRGKDIAFEVVSNPEFLKEGAAIKDFMSPDRVVVGVESDKAKLLLTRLYKPFLINNFRVIFMDIPSAEMTKYAANSMLATRISFMNDIANLCELVGADVNMVRQGIGSDTRIGRKFLYAGCGYGGSCFPKDVKALIKTADNNGYSMEVLKAVERVNEHQKTILFEKLKTSLGNLDGRNIAVWGLSFKPETDDMRESTALVMLSLLLKSNCHVRVYDPVAMDECRRRISVLAQADKAIADCVDNIEYCRDMYEATLDADALLLLTEWKEFRLPSWDVISRSMRNQLVIDGRNIFDSDELADAGFEYHCIGR